MKNFFTYIARCADQSLYAGSTNNIAEREKRHNTGRGSKYTRGRLPLKIIYTETFDTLQEAMAREREIKRLSKAKKEQLINFGHPKPKGNTTLLTLT